MGVTIQENVDALDHVDKGHRIIAWFVDAQMADHHDIIGTFSSHLVDHFLNSGSQRFALAAAVEVIDELTIFHKEGRCGSGDGRRR